jgi:hypothetical protein
MNKIQLGRAVLTILSFGGVLSGAVCDVFFMFFNGMRGNKEMGVYTCQKRGCHKRHERNTGIYASRHSS